MTVIDNTPKYVPALNLPDFPWDTISVVRQKVMAHPDGGINLSVGAPVDDTDLVIRQALMDHCNAPGYPSTVGSEELRRSIVDFYERRRGVSGLDPKQVLITVGSKELVASLPMQLGVKAGDIVGFPQISYPTYEVGAALVGAIPLRLGSDVSSWPTGEQAPKLVWLNSPGNPDGHIDSVEFLRQVVAWARKNNVIVACDECYALFCWQATCGTTGCVSLLDQSVTDGDLRGLLVAHSLSKQSNFAGFRGAWLVGDPELIERVALVRKHWGLMVPQAVQAAMIAALNDDTHVDKQVSLYRARREILLEATHKAGLLNAPECEGGLYLWVRRKDVKGDESKILNKASLNAGRLLLEELAELGILGAPGDFYGPGGADFVRLALTATDEQISRAAKRLSESNTWK